VELLKEAGPKRAMASARCRLASQVILLSRGRDVEDRINKMGKMHLMHFAPFGAPLSRTLIDNVDNLACPRVNDDDFRDAFAEPHRK
jgi:hypothetical protein